MYKSALVFIALLVAFVAMCQANTVTNNPSMSQLVANDNTVLNYALTLEHLEDTFYQQFLNTYSKKDFENAGYDATVYSYIQLISAHESAHVAALTSTLKSRKATAVKACTYNFNNAGLGKLNSVKKYLALARVLENTGVSAYDGAIDSIYDKTLQQVAASIATVEARHASYLNLLNNAVPFPSVFDTALNGTTVAAAIGPILVSCPQPVKLPTVLVVIPVKAPKGEDSNPTYSDTHKNDIETLNYALTLEHLEAALYTKYQAKYKESDFTKAHFSKQSYSYLNLIKEHEQAHVAALTATIKALGGKPVPACTYDFSTVKSVADYIATAQAFENVGVSAYDGAVNTINALNLRQVAATIATVEGRHAAYLNNLRNMVPFPDTFDPTRTPKQVVAIVVPAYIKSCPDQLELPQVLVVEPYNNGSSSHHHSSSSSSSSAASFSPSIVVVAVVAAVLAALY